MLTGAVTTNNFEIIRAILHGIDSQMDSPVINRSDFDYNAVGCTENRWARLVEIMCEDGLVRGCQKSLGAPGGRPQSDNLRITLAGLKFLRDGV